MKYLITSFLALLFLVTAFAQPKQPSSSEIQKKIEKLQVLGNVLYVAAHPDDENTRLIAYLSKGKMLNTAYLSLTRGDGGQNLVGSEIGEQLGVIRTQELLAARRVDGGQQFFTRARDFGYSKNPKETFEIWGKDEVLEDVVRVIRKFKPDVIITRFNQTPGTTHGHHTASAMLAAEAFSMAANPKSYSSQLKTLDTWQSKKLAWNTSYWFYRGEDFDTTGLTIIDVGAYDPLLGTSYTEIAAQSRTQHKSQGFGSSGSRGEQLEYLEIWENLSGKEGVFGGLDFTWNRVAGGDEIEILMETIARNYDPKEPFNSIYLLNTAYDKLSKINDKKNQHLIDKKKNELQEIIQDCLGLFIEASTDEFEVSSGQEITYKIEAINRSEQKVYLEKITWPNGSDSLTVKMLKRNSKFEIESTQQISETASNSSPYWLAKEGKFGLFTVEKTELIGTPENKQPLVAKVTFSMKKSNYTIEVPIYYKTTDPVKGEIQRPIAITPKVMLNVKENVLITPGVEKQIEVTVIAGKDNVSGILEPIVPKKWKIKPSKLEMSFERQGEEQTAIFRIIPPGKQSAEMLKIEFVSGTEKFTKGIERIEYDHIPTQTLFPEATISLVNLELETRGTNIGYINGAGDDVGNYLALLGYNITVIEENEIATANLKNFDAVFVGIRAYNTVERLAVDNPKLLEYVKNGGNLIVQYNTSHRLVMNDFAPYPLTLSRDRVTDENAKVKLVAQNHPVLNFPNKITAADFEGWVQERGLYFPNEWASEYVNILEMNDPGETPKKGSLLVATYGKGFYVYTGLSFFRELPAGVPGAYRLLANMIALGSENELE
ncbi:MAG: LmbE family N-acetylglucosaminyl deacetylase [Sphingobacteriales bacterium]|jgi:LmbE family N-acetylglucosaminyl deacetylase